MNESTILGAVLIFGLGFMSGVYVARRWLLRRERGTKNVPHRRRGFDFRVMMIDLFWNQKWLVLPGLDEYQHYELAWHIVRSPGCGAAKLTYAELTPADEKIMSRGQLHNIRPAMIGKGWVDYNPRTKVMTPLPLLGEWAHGILRVAVRTEWYARKTHPNLWRVKR